MQSKRGASSHSRSSRRKGGDCQTLKVIGMFSAVSSSLSLTMLVTFVVALAIVPGINGFLPSSQRIQPSSTVTPCPHGPTSYFSSARFAAIDDDDDDDDNDDDDYGFSPEANMLENFAASSKKAENMFMDGQLGINLEIEPMTKEEAEELKKEAKKMIEEKFDETIKEMEGIREKTKEEIAKLKETQEMRSQLEAQVQSQELMAKIDKLTNNFMQSTQDARKSTKLAAAADKATAQSGQGVEMGTWGVLGDRNVLTGAGFLGSIASSKLGGGAASMDGSSSTSISSLESSTQVTTNRILVIADVKGDPVAKALLPSLKEALETKTRIPNLEIEVLAPSATMPLGANNAACVVLFLPSISQASSLNAIFDRLLRKTFNEGGQLGKPPTQLVAISTHGTSRYDQFPFNMQNMMGGGKLEKRSQIEEALIQIVRQRENPPPLDYIIIKVGEKNFVANGGSAGMQLLPDDVLEEATSVETATAAIVEAMAFQPFARNATLCLEGCVTNEQMEDPAFWDESFLPLEGPEVWRNTKSNKNKKDSGGTDLTNLGPSSRYNSLVEYVGEWAELLAETGKGLTTPILAARGIESKSSSLMQTQDGVRLLFLPTTTGKNYQSREEELKKEKSGKSGSGSQAPSASKASIDEKLRQTKRAKEGGIDVVVEVTKDDQLRVRARRCNYADDAVLKELSEETILKRLKDALEVWKNDHA
ncbi:unnamed protein product [Cylindrotheca closterium]|uniref:Uncharacterized protein n=1 Tax=Cylindrotheca closterium TaxID=2856 RepID=A0AAD2CVR1_9STRA|nr:unnamed protein product [Cylindrotheca closterium]